MHTTRSSLSETERFWSKVNQTESCWLWTGTITHGYGRFWSTSEQREVSAHRRSFELARSEIPEGMQIDHICRNRACVRPDHLRVVTNKQNCENLGARRGSRSGVRGVVWHGQSKMWRAIVRHNNREHSAGVFWTIPEAEAAVIALRLRLFTHNVADRTPMEVGSHV